MRGSIAAAVLLSACASKPPSPRWEREAQSASERATQAYLQGQGSVADVEWRKAFDEVAATGQPATMARMALLQCAVQTAALALDDCPRYARYAAGAAPEEQAYARYLAGTHSAADVVLLPSAQQAVAAQLLDRGQPLNALPQGLPLSQLTAAGVALRTGAITRSAVQQAAHVASEQGWRRAVMAWLLLAQRLATAQGDAAGAQAVQLQLQVLEEDQKVQIPKQKQKK